MVQDIENQYATKTSASFSNYLQNISAIDKIVNDRIDKIDEITKIEEEKTNKRYNEYLAWNGILLLNASMKTINQEVASWIISTEKANILKTVMMDSVENTLWAIAPVTTQDLTTIESYINAWYTPKQVVAHFKELERYKVKPTIQDKTDLWDVIRFTYSDGTIKDVKKNEKVTLEDKTDLWDVIRFRYSDWTEKDVKKSQEPQQKADYKVQEVDLWDRVRIYKPDGTYEDLVKWSDKISEKKEDPKLINPYFYTWFSDSIQSDISSTWAKNLNGSDIENASNTYWVNPWFLASVIKNVYWYENVDWEDVGVLAQNMRASIDIYKVIYWKSPTVSEIVTWKAEDGSSFSNSLTNDVNIVNKVKELAWSLNVWKKIPLEQWQAETTISPDEIYTLEWYKESKWTIPDDKKDEYYSLVKRFNMASDTAKVENPAYWTLNRLLRKAWQWQWTSDADIVKLREPLSYYLKTWDNTEIHDAIRDEVLDEKNTKLKWYREYIAMKYFADAIYRYSQDKNPNALKSTITEIWNKFWIATENADYSLYTKATSMEEVLRLAWTTFTDSFIWRMWTINVSSRDTHELVKQKLIWMLKRAEKWKDVSWMSADMEVLDEVFAPYIPDTTDIVWDYQWEATTTSPNWNTYNIPIIK